MRRLLFALALSLAACGPSPAPTTQAPTAPAAPPPDDAAMQAKVAALAAPYNEADFAAGRRVFALCNSCHTPIAGAPNRTGPNLHGMFGRQAGTLEGFAFSPAMQAAGFAWDGQRLNDYLAAPATFLPGNRMAFAGVRNETQRRDVIAYLMVVTAE